MIPDQLRFDQTNATERFLKKQKNIQTLCMLSKQ